LGPGGSKQPGLLAWVKMMDELAAWAPFGAALAAFLGSHAIPARPPIRRRLTAVLGEHAYVALYSLVSIVLLFCLLHTASTAPFVEIWAFDDWQRHVPALLVPAGFALCVAGLFSPNPLSLSATRQPFKAERPGIIALTRHPVLLGLALWAAAHMVPNGDLAHLILFGTFLALAVGGMWIMDKRARRRLGEAEWQRLAGCFGWFSLPQGLGWIDRRLALLATAGVATALVAAVLHPYFAGVPALG
jgi:uncharacterized membrane protein